MHTLALLVLVMYGITVALLAFERGLKRRKVTAGEIILSIVNLALVISLAVISL